MLRALAQLGVIHEPDLTEEMAQMMDSGTFDQLSRSDTSVQTLERYGGSLTIAHLSIVEDLEPELVHIARNGGHGREILTRAAEVVSQRVW